MIYRQDPLVAPPIENRTFNLISRKARSFRYLTKVGRVATWYYNFEDLLVAMDDPACDFGFLLVEAVQFLPSEPELTTDKLGRVVLNLWRRPEWQLLAALSAPSIFLEHVSYLFDGDSEAVDHVLDWIAHLVQRPQQWVNHAILLTSEAKGIGRSTLGTIIRRLVGERNSRVAQSKDLKSQFDGWLVGQLVIQVDEIYEYGNWDLANKLKPLITEPTVSVNMKYGPQMEVQNFARLLMFSNNTTPIDLEKGDRRYFVFDSKAQPRDANHYEMLNRFIDSDAGMSSIYTYLMRRDIAHFKPYAYPPTTQAKEGLVEASGSPLKHYIRRSSKPGTYCRSWADPNSLWTSLSGFWPKRAIAAKQRM
jgi:Family of unknown function (DUF5906)